jgi:hypothetical protein
MSKESDRLIPSPDALNTTLLDRAWGLFHLYDHHANCAQKRFIILREWILFFGVLAVYLAVLQSISSTWELWLNPQWFHDIVLELLRWFVILVPIAITVLLTGAVKFDRGTGWVILRSGAEAIKGEIYRYCCRVGHYKNGEMRDRNFANSLQQISERLMKTQVNQVGIDREIGSDSAKENDSSKNADFSSPITDKGNDSPKNADFSSPLTAEKYIKKRILDQLNFYRSKIKNIYRESQRLYWLVYILGGLSTFLAAINQGVWVAVTTTASTAIVSYIAIRQLDNTLINYNQAATNLDNLLVWWDSLSPTAQANFDNFEKLVNNAENILGTEVSGWVQEMQNALADLYKEERNKISENASEEQRDILSKTLVIEDRHTIEQTISVEERSTEEEVQNS